MNENHMLYENKYVLFIDHNEKVDEIKIDELTITKNPQIVSANSDTVIALIDKIKAQPVKCVMVRNEIGNLPLFHKNFDWKKLFYSQD